MSTLNIVEALATGGIHATADALVYQQPVSMGLALIAGQAAASELVACQATLAIQGWMKKGSETSPQDAKAYYNYMDPLLSGLTYLGLSGVSGVDQAPAFRKFLVQVGSSAAANYASPLIRAVTSGTGSSVGALVGK